MNNHTTDLDGPVAVRYWFDQRLTERKGYQTKNLDQMDESLRAMGITDGGQLAGTTPQELGRRLGVDAVIYCDLLEFQYQTTGFLNVRKVRARFKMVNCTTGETLWENEGLGANSEGAVSSSAALQAGIKHLSAQLTEKAMQSPLRTEIWDMVWNAIEFLPRGR